MRGWRARRGNDARALAALAGLAVLLAGCGNNTPQDKSEPKGSFPLAVQKATFPDGQKLAKPSRMEIDVRNAGRKTVPDVSVTVRCKSQSGQGSGGSASGQGGNAGGFSYNTTQKGVADPARPQFVVDKIPTRTPRPASVEGLELGPLERSTSFVDTYALGSLAPGKSVKFTWDVTAVKAGPYRICWQVNAGLYGKAKAVTASDSALPLHGQFSGTVSNKAPIAEVTPSGKVVTVPSVEPSK